MSRKSGIVNVRMVITEEKILSNIDKIQKMINPNSKKQIVQLDEDIYFKDLVESVKSYLVEYPKKKNFPKSVYNASYGLVEYATSQFEENTKKVEELIRQREENIILAGKLRELIETVENRKENWKQKIEEYKDKFPEEIIETLRLVGKDKSRKSQNYQDALKLLNARVNNLESNLHIEIDMERTEDRSKALSFIGIEIAEALKLIPKPADFVAEEIVQEDIVQEKTNKSELVENTEEVENAKKVKKVSKKKEAKPQVEIIEEKVENKEEVENVVEVQEVEKIEEVEENDEVEAYQESISFEKKPSLWQKIKNSKLGRAISYVLKIKIRIELPALPEGRGENDQ